MKIIKELSEMIEEEIADAEKYAKCALDKKESNPAMAEMFFKLANDEMGHMSTLHTMVASVIDEYRKKNGDPPEGMLIMYEIFHRKHIQAAATVKGLLSLYRDKEK